MAVLPHQHAVKTVGGGHAQDDLDGGAVEVTAVAADDQRLAGALPADRMGYFMGLFNFFVVIPQICSGVLLGFFTKHLFDGHTGPTLALGGASMALAGILTLFVTDAGKAARAT